jgi:hypothetical protein
MEIVLWDLDQGEMGRIPGLQPGWPFGDIAWSPRGNALVYIQNEDGCGQGRSAVAHVDLPDLRPIPLLEAVSPDFINVEWAAPDRIHLVDGNGLGWTVDLPPK